MRHRALAVVAVGCIAGTLPLRAQQSATTQRLVDARQQIGAHRLDSAATLLRGVIGSSDASASRRAEAFMWLGVVSFSQGHDSGAAAAFREALKGEPLLAAEPVLARLDSATCSCAMASKEALATLPARPAPTLSRIAPSR